MSYQSMPAGLVLVILFYCSGVYGDDLRIEKASSEVIIPEGITFACFDINIKNTSDRECDILNIKSGCGCISYMGDDLPISMQSGKSRSFRFKALRKEIGKWNKEIIFVYSNGVRKEKAFSTEISVLEKKDFDVSPLLLTLSSSKTKSGEVRVIAKANERIADVELKCSSNIKGSISVKDPEFAVILFDCNAMSKNESAGAQIRIADSNGNSRTYSVVAEVVP